MEGRRGGNRCCCSCQAGIRATDVARATCGTHCVAPPLDGPDLLLGTGFYGGMALGWVALLAWWEFLDRAAFITVGA
jgi:hypothetical protein